MTKSFTALAVLRLRDEGRLSLDDSVARWVPEFERVSLPTKDSAPIRVRHLLTHASGLPEDNPWGDQQLGASDADLTRWLRAGVPFSTPPGTRYEYSNYAFALLGRIVSRASGQPYERYLKTAILQPLGMKDTVLESAEVPAARKATGYRRHPDGTYSPEPPLPQGAFGAMGGLWTTAEDLGRYVAFHLNAFPPRDDAEAGPVRRASVREMNSLAWWNQLESQLADGRPKGRVSGYGYGLGVTADCRFARIVSHGGGLPGYGSHMAWLPDYGVGIFAMTNLTYAGPGQVVNQAWDRLAETGALQPRVLPASRSLEHAREQVFEFWRSGRMDVLQSAAAMNLFLDVPAPERRAQVSAIQEQVGQCSMASPVRAENWLRGQFDLTCERGTVGVFVTLAPTTPPGIQYLNFRKIQPGDQMGASTSAPFGVRCAP